LRVTSLVLLGLGVGLRLPCAPVISDRGGLDSNQRPTDYEHGDGRQSAPAEDEFDPTGAVNYSRGYAEKQVVIQPAY
jgi:hypothetical protein